MQMLLCGATLAVVISFLLMGVMILLTPKKGFEVLDERIVVKCNRCGRVQLQRSNQTCVQCGNKEVKKK